MSVPSNSRLKYSQVLSIGDVPVVSCLKISYLRLVVCPVLHSLKLLVPLESVRKILVVLLLPHSLSGVLLNLYFHNSSDISCSMQLFNLQVWWYFEYLLLQWMSSFVVIGCLPGYLVCLLVKMEGFQELHDFYCLVALLISLSIFLAVFENLVV